MSENPYFSNSLISNDLHFFALDPLFLPDNWRVITRDCSAPFPVTVNSRVQKPALCYFTYMSHTLRNLSINNPIFVYHSTENLGLQSLFHGIEWTHLILSDWLFIFVQVLELIAPLFLLWRDYSL